MKTYEEVYKIVTTVILDNFRLLEEQLYDSVLLEDELGLDSLDLLDLFCQIEDYYQQELNETIDISPYKAQGLKVLKGTLKDLCIFILKIVNGEEV